METVITNNIIQAAELDIKITGAAKAKITSLLATEPGLMFRIYADSEGCSRIKYYFMFEQPEEEDLIINDPDLKFLVDPITISYLQGATLDYLQNSEYTGFSIINSHPTKGGCGCDRSSCC